MRETFRYVDDSQTRGLWDLANRGSSLQLDLAFSRLPFTTTLSVSGGVSNVRVDAIDKEIKTEANQKHQPRKNRCRRGATAFACEKRVQGRTQQPYLHDQQHGNKRHGACDGGQSTGFGRQFTVSRHAMTP